MYSSCAGDNSTTFPRYITAIRLETWRTTLKSSATKMYDSPSWSCKSSSRLTTWAWIDTSSADTVSSSTISWVDGQGAGDANALALAARELMGEPVGVLWVEPDLFEKLT